MSVTVTALRNALATRLSAITGLRVSAVIPDQLNPPIAIIALDGITFDRAFHRGMDEYRFMVTVVVGRASERAAQNRLDGYLAPTGDGSVKTAIEADTSLGGIAQTLRVTEMTGLASVSQADDTYLTATFMVVVNA